MRTFGMFLLICCLAIFGNANAAQVNKIAAVVNGQIITMLDLQKEAIPELARAKIHPNEVATSKQAQDIFKKVLDLMIMDILIGQEAKRLKATVSGSEIDEELTKMMKARNLTKKQFEEQLARQKLSVETLRKNIEKNLLRQKVMGMEVGRKVVVTPDEIKNYYETHKAEMVNRDGLHMGLLVYPPNVNAASIASQIKSGKLSFAAAAAKYSIAPNKDKGGDTGPVDWDRLNPEWEGRLNKMKAGDVTELFNVQGFKAQIHLFRPGGGEDKPLTLKEATPRIDAILRQPKAMERYEGYAKQLRDKAVIDIRM